jgi:hypothetical protein
MGLSTPLPLFRQITEKPCPENISGSRGKVFMKKHAIFLGKKLRSLPGFPSYTTSESLVD